MGFGIFDASIRMRSTYNLPGMDLLQGVASPDVSALQDLLQLFPDMLAAGPSSFMQNRTLPFMAAPRGYNSYALNNALGFLGKNPAQLNFGQLGGASYGMAMSFQAIFMQRSIVPIQASKIEQASDEPDKFATHQACRTGLDNPSNMNDADHLKLAIYQCLNRSGDTRGQFKALQPAELQKQLKEEYGIDSELTKIKTKSGDEVTGLKFKNGKIFADGAGDGKLDMGDYNFKGAIDDMKERLGLSDDDLTKIDDAMRSSYSQQKDLVKQLEAVPGYKDLPADLKDQYAQMLTGGAYQPNAAENAFRQVTGQNGFNPFGGQFGQFGGGFGQFGGLGGSPLDQLGGLFSQFGSFGQGNVNDPFDQGFPQQGFGFPGMQGSQYQIQVFMMMMQAYRFAS